MIFFNVIIKKITKSNIIYQKGILERCMIKIKLSELLGKNKMTRKQLAELVGVRPNSIGDLYNENVKKLDLHTLDKICDVFQCQISDILEHQPNNEEKDY